MKSTPPWILAFYVLTPFIIVSHSSAPVVADGGNSGFISIDCGATRDYVDEASGIWYQIDEGFIGSGTNHELSTTNYDKFPTVKRQLMTLRSFLEGERNCYTLKPTQDQKHKYLIRAIFAYGNYDNKSQVPIFDLYLGVNYWDTVQLPNLYRFYYYDIILQQVLTDVVQVCLVNTGRGTPFINAVELRPLNASFYSNPLPLYLWYRADCGSGLPYTVVR